MSEERFSRIETMLADMIRIVGNTNAMVEELRDEQRSLRGEVEVLRGEVEDLRSDMNALRGEVSVLRGDTDSLRSEVAFLRKDVELIKSAMATKEDINQLNERLDFYMNKSARQDEDIYRLKRLIGIK